MKILALFLVLLTVIVAVFVTISIRDWFSEDGAESEFILDDINTRSRAVKPVYDAEAPSKPSKPSILSDSDQTVILDVPFTSQAPSGHWSDARQEYGCEEASSLMAWHWLRGETLLPAQAEQEIINMSDWQLENYGEFRDRSAADTTQMFKEYFGYSNVSISYNISTQDIKTELDLGNLVIVPVNGQKLKNPYFTPPGPIQHMLVVRGYDDGTREFITNDPGTRSGEAFRYSYQNLSGSLQDYKTGFHEPIDKIMKVMIVVEK
jgi:hypothetical protein